MLKDTNQKPPRFVWPTFIWVALAFCLFWVLTIIALRSFKQADSYEAGRAKVRLEKLDAMRKEEQAKLGTYAWAKKEEGAVRIPVERAMEVVLAELKNKEVRASNVPVPVVQPPAEVQQPANVPAVPVPEDAVNPATGVPAQNNNGEAHP